MSCVARKEGFTQVVVWPGTTCKEESIKDFEQFILDEFGTRAQYLEQISTKPDLDSNGRAVPDTGGRIDLFFAIHQDDIGKFAVPRLGYGMRWIEDSISTANGGNVLYPEYVKDYCTWTA